MMPTHSSRRTTLLLTAMLAACSSAPERSGPSVTIGLLLPYTGADRGTAATFEESVLYAADRINAAGGVHGLPVRIVEADTHSDPSRAVASAQALVAAGASVVLGPESADVAPSLLPVFAASGVVFISPFIGAADDSTVRCSPPWFRLAPSAAVLGRALAKLLSSKGVTRVAVVASTTGYDQSLKAAAESQFVARGGQIAADLTVDPSAQSYSDAVATAVQSGASAVLLAAPPASAALFVDEFAASSATPPQWYFSPLLKTDLFVQNVAPQAIEGAFGVSPANYDNTGDFARAFARQWAGEQPLEGAYFYYDAMALTALALQSARVDADGRADAASLESAIVRVAGPPGVSVTWNQLEQGLTAVGAGQSTYYSGLSGPMVLDSCGDRELGTSNVWTVTGGTIADLAP